MRDLTRRIAAGFYRKGLGIGTEKCQFNAENELGTKSLFPCTLQVPYLVPGYHRAEFLRTTTPCFVFFAATWSVSGE